MDAQPRLDVRTIAGVHQPAALARLHRRLQPGDRATITGLGDGSVAPVDLLAGAGLAPTGTAPSDGLVVERQRTLPDDVGPEMRVLFCGLNPSVYAADAGVGYARPGNRFWPATVAAGLTCGARDGAHALEVHLVGMTDLVKRASPGAGVLTAAEYRAGLERVDALCRWLRPAVVCMVGLAGVRAALDRSIAPGWQEHRIGGRPTYVMPSTSGRNASSSMAVLVEHLRRVAEASGPM